MSQVRAARLKKLPRAILPKGGAFGQGPTALILLLPSLVVVFGIVLYPLLRTLYTSLFDVNSALCATCRIEYLEGEPQKMTRAEVEVLESRDLLGQVRLSCQALCEHDMKVRILMTVSSSSLEGSGPKPQPEITPPPEWVDKPS